MAVHTSCKIEVCDAGYVVSLVGKCTMQQSPAFRDFVDKCFNSGLFVVLDLTECEMLDSTFLGCLIGLHKQSLQLGGTQFRVYADSNTRLHLLSTSGLHTLFDYSEQLPDTIGDCLTLEIGRIDTQDLGRHVMNSHEQLADLQGSDAGKFRSIADRLQNELERPASN